LGRYLVYFKDGTRKEDIGEGQSSTSTEES